MLWGAVYNGCLRLCMLRAQSRGVHRVKRGNMRQEDAI